MQQRQGHFKYKRQTFNDVFNIYIKYSFSILSKILQNIIVLPKWLAYNMNKTKTKNKWNINTQKERKSLNQFYCSYHLKLIRLIGIFDLQKQNKYHFSWE